MDGFANIEHMAAARLATVLLAGCGLFGCADCSSDQGGATGGSPTVHLDAVPVVDSSTQDIRHDTAIAEVSIVDTGAPPLDVPVSELDAKTPDGSSPDTTKDVKAPSAPDGVCPAPDPAAPKAGESCEAEGASRCSETGVYAADLLENPKQYICARPNRLLCSKTDAGLIWTDVACPIPPESCNKNQAVTCIEESGGTRCCPTRCRENPDWPGAGHPQTGTVLCSDPTIEVCTGFPWMNSSWIHGCGLLEESIFAEGHTDCLEWCQGCTYYYPKIQCPPLYYCQTECGGYDGECYIDDNGHAACPDPDATPCKWHDGDCDP